MENKSKFKAAINGYGREITVSATIGGKLYGDDAILSVKPHFEGALCCSVMKCLDIELDGQLLVPAGTKVENVRFGARKSEDESFYYREYEDYVIFEDGEIDVENNKTTLECYDALIYSMVPYILKPDFASLTVGKYLKMICEHLDYEFDMKDFVNSDVPIESEQYSENDTFRTVLDDIAGATGSIIAVEGRKLSVIYPKDYGDIIDDSMIKRLTISETYGPINSVVLARTPQEDNVYKSDPKAEKLCELKIENNRLMDSHRDYFINNLYESLKGLQYTALEAETFGVGVLNLGDVITVEREDGRRYKTVVLSDELEITQGVSEKIAVSIPTTTSTDYSAAESADKQLLKAVELKVNKQNNTISSIVSDVKTLENSVETIGQSVKTITTTTEQITEITTHYRDNYYNGVKKVDTTTGFVMDEDGFHVKKTEGKTESLLDDTGLKVTDASSKERILFAGYDKNTGESVVETKNLHSQKYLTMGTNARFEDFEDNRTACFYVGGDY